MEDRLLDPDIFSLPAAAVVRTNPTVSSPPLRW
jgi:hypothetical protein